MRAFRAVNRNCLRSRVRLPDIFDVQHSQHLPFGLAKCELLTRTQVFGHLFGDVQCDGDRPQCPVGQAHGFANGVVVGALHEAGERGKAAVQNKFQVAELAGGQLP